MNRFLLILILFTTPYFSQKTVDYNILNHINAQATNQGVQFNQLLSASDTPISLGIPLAFGITYYVKKNRSHSIFAIEQLGSHLINSTLTIGLKYLVHRPRPFNTYSTIEKYGKAGSLSFPSGHTSMAFATATSISLNYPKWYIVCPAYLWACSVGYSRMYLGVHYPSDVLVGAIIGSGSALLIHYLFSKHKNFIFVKHPHTN